MDAIKNKFTKVKEELNAAQSKRDEFQQECKEWRQKYDEVR